MESVSFFSGAGPSGTVFSGLEMPADGYLHAHIIGNGIYGTNFQLKLTGAKKTTPVYAPHNYDVTWEVSKGEVLTLTWTRANYSSSEDTRGSFYTYPAGE